MFHVLAEDHHYRAILHVVAGLADIEESFETVGRWKDGVNHGLNPISLPRKMHMFSETMPRLKHAISHSDKKVKYVWESEVNQAIAYIEMNKKLLGKESPPELMQLLRELRVYRSFVEAYSDEKRFSVEVESKRGKGAKCTISYMSAFVDDVSSMSELSTILDSILGNK